MAKEKMRISGTGFAAAPVGVPAAKADDGTWAIDVGAISTNMAVYLEAAAKSGKYSVAGLCIGLGITRETYVLWRCGYVNDNDAGDVNVERNEALAECMAMGELHLQKYWEESEKSTSLHMKMLESTGAIGQKAASKSGPPFDLGALKKYGR